MDYGTIQVIQLLLNQFVFKFILFSEYVNKYLLLNKKLEQDWVLNILPVS